MFCVECGKRLDDDAKFCSSCGKPQKQAGDANAEQENQQTEESKTGESQTEENVSFTLPDTVDNSIKVYDAAISSNGKYIVFIPDNGSASSLKNIINIIDTQSKEVVYSVNSNCTDILAVSSSGNLIVTKRYADIFLRDAEKNEYIHEMYCLTRSCFAFCPNSQRLAYILSNGDYDLEVIKIQDRSKLITINGKENAFLDAHSIAYSHDGCYLVVSNGIILDARNGNTICKMEVPIESMQSEAHIVISHDGKRVITFINEVVSIWDIQKGSIWLQIGIGKKTRPGHFEDCAICLSPDDRTLVAGYSNGIIRYFNAETGELLKQFPGDKSAIKWLSFTPDGKTLISFAGTPNQTIKFWVADN